MNVRFSVKTQSLIAVLHFGIRAYEVKNKHTADARTVSTHRRRGINWAYCQDGSSEMQKRKPCAFLCCYQRVKLWSWRLTGKRIIRYTTLNLWSDYSCIIEGCGGVCLCTFVCVCFCKAEGINELWDLWMFSRGRGDWLFLLPFLRSCDGVCPEGACRATIDLLVRLLPWSQDALMN